MIEPILLIAGSFLLGALPLAYLATRHITGLDIREHGSGNAGATNVIEHVGLRTGIIIGTFDFFAKGTLPVVIAKLLDLSLGIQVAAGLVAVLGHNWSPFMRFTGGRGVATAMGVCIGFGLWQEALVLGLVIGVIGRLIFRDTGFWTLIAMITLPVLTAVFDRPSEVIAMAIAIVIILVAKRLIANGEAPATSHPLLQVLTYRLLWDRDVSHRTSWTRRAPNG
ncbi:MAG TPA: glycerol-3-phosphate acyltransferase [SAR202 cluster bacterium]|nr:glycerol-3-phosphate acyltransferase [SAR202 cluster bacterium]HJO80806.1 glycerol-3-phosphate acyltransferase [SAR202 cluster bacterium]